jgi:transcriptional regulator with XRE-family HTH domain
VAKTALQLRKSSSKADSKAEPRGDPKPEHKPTRRSGQQLRQVRRKQGLSRAEVARSAGLTRRELAAYERGRVQIPDSDLWCLAGSCGVDVGELLPQRAPLHVESDLSTLAIGDSIRHLRSPNEPDGTLREYMATIYELRNLPPGTTVPLREADLAALADALGETPEAIESRLVEVVGTNREEAARLRAMILSPETIEAADPDALVPGDGGTAESYAAALHDAPESEADFFFAAPRADDPFGAPPPLEPVSPVAPVPVLAAGSDAGLPVDPFAGPVTPASPVAPAVPSSDGLSPIVPEATAWAAADAAADAPAATPADARGVHDPGAPGWQVAPVAPATPGPTPVVPVETAPAIAPIAWQAVDDELLTETLVMASEPDGPDLVASNGFTRAGPGWQVGGAFPATATTDDGALALRRGDTRWALSDLSAPSDLVVEAVVDHTAGTGFGILFRAGIDDDDQLFGYSFDLDATTGEGTYLLRQWSANQPHWRPLAQAPVRELDRLHTRVTIAIALRDDSITADVNGQRVLEIPSLTQLSNEVGLEACRGDRLGIQAAVTTEVTLDRLSAAQH